MSFENGFTESANEDVPRCHCGKKKKSVQQKVTKFLTGGGKREYTRTVWYCKEHDPKPPKKDIDSDT